jgi:hypothetical protein
MTCYARDEMLCSDRECMLLGCREKASRPGVTVGEGEVKEWIIYGRFTFDGHALVEAETAEEAIAKFGAGNFEFDAPTASCVDWESRGKPEEA